MSAPDNLIIRPAIRQDLAAILAMLLDDFLGATRENAGDDIDENYVRFFDLIEADSNNTIYVAESEGETVGTFQLTYIPNITFGGSWRVQVEAVRIASAWRGRGLGKMMIEWIVEQARQRDCVMVQLTTNKERTKALEFYHNLGFVASHEGFKMVLK